MSESSALAQNDSTADEAPSARPPALQDVDRRAAAQSHQLPAEKAFTLEELARLWSIRDRHSLAASFGCACAAVFDTQWELKRHQDLAHPRPAPAALVCSHCHRSFGRYYRLARHLAAVGAEVAGSRGGTAADEAHWPGPTDIASRLNALPYNRRSPRRHLEGQLEAVRERIERM